MFSRGVATANRFPFRRRRPVVDPAWRKREKNKARIAGREHTTAHKTPFNENATQETNSQWDYHKKMASAQCVVRRYPRQTHYMWMAVNLRIAMSQ